MCENSLVYSLYPKYVIVSFISIYLIEWFYCRHVTVELIDVI